MPRISKNTIIVQKLPTNSKHTKAASHQGSHAHVLSECSVSVRQSVERVRNCHVSLFDLISFSKKKEKVEVTESGLTKNYFSQR